jgi:hypothetical protein
MIKKMTNRAIDRETKKFKERTAHTCGIPCSKLCNMLAFPMAGPYTGSVYKP